MHVKVSYSIYRTYDIGGAFGEAFASMDSPRGTVVSTHDGIKRAAVRSDCFTGGRGREEQSVILFTASHYNYEAQSISWPTADTEPSLLYKQLPVPTADTALGSYCRRRAGLVAMNGKYRAT